MTTGETLTGLVRDLRRQCGAGPADGELLTAFAARRDEAAFAELVGRHGPLVLGVARRHIPDRHAADDVVQSTFAALARNAPKLGNSESLVSWLYVVALRHARKARLRFARAAARLDRLPQPCPTRDPLTELTGRELLTIIDDELSRLPTAYRLPLLLCAVEGLSREEAARRLDWPPGSVKGRLERGRELLRTRLAKRGLTVPAVLTGGLLTTPAEALTPALVRVIVNTVLAAQPAAPPVKLLAVAAAVLMAIGVGVATALVPAGQPEPKASPPPAAAAAPQPRTDALGDPLPAGALARLGSRRLRPGDWIEGLAFSPDGSKLACWANARHRGYVLTVWDTITGRLLRRVDLGQVQLKLLRWRADGHGVAVVRNGVEDYYVWDFADETAPVPRVPDGVMMNQGADGLLLAVALSADGRTLAAGRLTMNNGPRTFEVWDVALNKPLKDLPNRALGTQVGHGAAVTFTSDGKTLLAVSRRLGDQNWSVQFGTDPTVPGESAEQARLVAWDVATGKERKAFDVTAPGGFTRGFGTHHPVPESYAVTPDGRTLVIGQRDGTVRLWDWANGKEVRSWMAHPAGKGTFEPAGVLAIAVAADGRMLVTAGQYGGLRRWGPATGRELVPPAAASRSDHVLAVSPDGKRLAAGGNGGQITLQDFATGAEVGSVPGHRGSVERVLIAPDGRTAQTAGADGAVCRWDLATGRQLSRVATDSPSLSWPTAFTPDGGRLIGRSIWRNSGRVTPYDKYLWDTATGKQLPLPDGWADPRLWLLTGPKDGTILVLDLKDQAVSLRDWPGGQVRQTWPGPTLQPPANAFETSAGAVSADGELVAAVGRDSVQQRDMGMFGAGHWSLCETASGQVRHHRTSIDAWYDHVAFLPDGTGMIVGGTANAPPTPVGLPRAVPQPEKALVLIDVTTGDTLRSFVPTVLPPNGYRWVLTLAVSPDGRQLAAAEGDHSIWVYEVATGQIRRHFPGHTNEVTALAFTPDGRRLVSTSRDLTGLVWDVSLAAGRAATAADPDRLWADLAKPEWDAAGPALAAQAQRPDTAVAMLRDRLKPAAAPEPADQLRALRAVELLEEIATPAARDHLTALAGGAAGAPLTRAAADALKRLR
jgi:RNA polymerase sigma factor (sigma-70 family)